MDYDYTISTEENYQEDDAPFVGQYKHIRKGLDYTYHKHYSKSRQLFQDKIITHMCNAIIYEEDGVTCDRPLENWIVFTAGAMGSGKSHTLSYLSERGLFPLWSFVRVDFDRLRECLPELSEYQRHNNNTAGNMTQKEVGYIAEILTLTGLEDHKNVIVDGSLRDYVWYAQYMMGLREKYPSSKLAIIHVTTSPVTALTRAEHREQDTGRHVPMEKIVDTMSRIPKSIEVLSPHVDYVCTFRNELEPELIYTSTGNLSLDGFRDVWEMTCHPDHIDVDCGQDRDDDAGTSNVGLYQVFQYEQCRIL